MALLAPPYYSASLVACYFVGKGGRWPTKVSDMVAVGLARRRRHNVSYGHLPFSSSSFGLRGRYQTTHRFHQQCPSGPAHHDKFPRKRAVLRGIRSAKA